MMSYTQYEIPETMQCLDGREPKRNYESVKFDPHFEWIDEYENILKEKAAEVFDTLGVKDGTTLKIAVDHFNEFQENLKTFMDDLVKMITDKTDVNEAAKTFVADWTKCVKYQLSRINEYDIGDGSSIEKIRWVLENTIKYLMKCAVHLATKDDGVEFKKDVSGFMKNVVMQNNVDTLDKIKNELEKLKNVSS